MLSLVVVLSHQGDDGAYYFMADDDTSREKAERHGLNPNRIKIRTKWSIANHLGKRVTIRINCAKYSYKKDGVEHEGMRVTKLVNLEAFTAAQ